LPAAARRLRRADGRAAPGAAGRPPPRPGRLGPAARRAAPPGERVVGARLRHLGGARHFTYSKVMTWVAFDRAVRSAEDFGLEGPVERWRKLRDAIHRNVCAH